MIISSKSAAGPAHGILIPLGYGAVKNLRWWIAGLLALATALNYLARQCFPVLVGEIRREIPIVFFSTAMFAHQFWSANVQTLPADLFPSRVVGSVEGLLGSAGAFGGILFGQLVGWLVGQHGYGPAFLIAGVLHPLAFLVILATVKRIAPLPAPAATDV